ncbi:hypothetical protein D1007_59360 [Hordeum vulgare]|nr:hypothetical protein D1007_59360 [Hordeum vulgare]
MRSNAHGLLCGMRHTAFLGARMPSSMSDFAMLSGLLYRLAILSLELVRDSRLAGKVAVITGAASGIGKASAAEFVKNGATVILADIQDDLGCAVAADLDEIQNSGHGRLDILFNNAGISGKVLTPTPLGLRGVADFDNVVTTNTRGVITGVKHAARIMIPSRGVAGEMARSGIQINAISLNYIPTLRLMAFTAQLYPGMSHQERKMVVEREINEMDGAILGVDDVANATDYLGTR